MTRNDIGAGSAIRVGGEEEALYVIGDAILERGDRPVVACRPKPIHLRFGKVLVFLADRLGRVDELEGGLAPGGAVCGGGEMGEAGCLAGADIEEPARRRAA